MEYNKGHWVWFGERKIEINQQKESRGKEMNCSQLPSLFGFKEKGNQVTSYSLDCCLVHYGKVRERRRIYNLILLFLLVWFWVFIMYFLIITVISIIFHIFYQY